MKGIPSHLINAECDRVLNATFLTGVKNHKVNTYSGGMRRRVSLCISLLGDPSIVILDEPTTGMDPKTRRGIWDLI